MAPSSLPNSTISLQPLIDALTSTYASVDSEDVSFDTIAKSVLEQCVQTRDRLEELHGRDDLVSFRCSSTQLYELIEESGITQGRPYSLLSPSYEADLLETLEARSRNGLSVAEAIIVRKLKLQRVRVAFFWSL